MKKRKKFARPALQIEHLEQRSMLAVYDVINTSTSGAGSLRQAILDANASAGADLIQFNIGANDANHLYYKNDGIAGQVSLANIVTTTASDDSNIADIDPDWAHSWYRIKPTTTLPIPTITGAVTIDGYTQPGASVNTLANGDNAVHRIQLDGSLAGSGNSAITIASGASTVRGLAFNSGGHGIKLQTLGGNVIEGNSFGTDISGTLDRGASGYGIWIIGSSDNLVGGTNLAARNLISGNNAGGVFITDSTTPAANNAVQGNFIGTNAAGTSAIANNVAGVYINNAQHNLVGGTAPGAGNLISGNLRGVYIQDTGSTAVEGYNVVEGNLIGTDVSGANRLFNSFQGVYIFQSDNNRIGGPTAAARNVISGNGQNGILITGNPNADYAIGNLVQGNWIGVDATGNGLMGNGTTGIVIQIASNTQVGGTTPGAGNLISYNGVQGIQVFESADTVVQGNVIGATLDGSPAGNVNDGIYISASQGTLIGGDAPGAGNLITRNGRNFRGQPGTRGPAGIRVQDGALPFTWLRAENNARDSYTAANHGTLQGGADFAPGRFGYAFQFDGVDDYVNLPDRAYNQTGSLEGGLRLSIDVWIRPNDVNSFQQIISKFGSGGDAYQLGLAPNGVLQADVNMGSLSTPNIQTLQSPTNAVVAGQWTHVAMTYDTNPKFWRLFVNGLEVASRTASIGVINDQGTTPVSIGRKSDGTQYFNGLIDEPAFYKNTVDMPAIYSLGGANKWHGTTIRGNSIFLNGDMGIDLTQPYGPNTNDVDDTDVGANDLQNSPLITSATSTGSQTTVQGSLRSIALTSYAIEVFASAQGEPYYGEIEGERLIGTGIAVTDGNGIATFSFTFPVGVPAGQFISATATVLQDHDGNPATPLASFDTSEFSNLATVTSSVVTGVKFHDLNGDGVKDAGEPGLQGWMIYLDANDNGVLDPTETRSETNFSGGWNFANLPVGTYHVREVAMSPWIQTTPPLDITVTSSNATFFAGAIGNYRLAGISGAKFNDYNENGILDVGEPRLPGWTIFLDANDNGTFDIGETGTITDDQGGYTFDGLPAGQYRVREVQQFGWRQTTVNGVVEVLPNQSAQTFAVYVGNFQSGTGDDGGNGDCGCCEGPLAVTTTLDVVANDGVTSLREAILYANSHANSLNPGGARDVITFCIPGDGPHTIVPLTELPTITEPVIIDGYTQLGSSVNTLPVGDDAVLKIQVDGQFAVGNGLVVASGQTTIRGLAIYGFFNAIQLGVPNGATVGGNVVEGCFIGTDATGAVRKSNLNIGIWGVNTTNTRIGTDGDGVNDPGERNIILGNASYGIFIESLSATFLSASNVIAGNYIGTDRTGMITDPGEKRPLPPFWRAR